MRKFFKNKKLIFAICFAIAIISFSAIGSTYAKFISRLSTNNEQQIAGFYITSGSPSSTQITNSILIAPGETKSLTLPISYFSQVNTKFSTEKEMEFKGNGIFADFSGLLEEYATYKALHNPAGKSPTTFTEMFTISYGGQTDLPKLIVSELVKAGLTKINDTTIKAMPEDAATALQVNIPITIKWQEHNDPDWDTWDTFLGSKFSQGNVNSTLSLSMIIRAEQS